MRAAVYKPQPQIGGKLLQGGQPFFERGERIIQPVIGVAADIGTDVLLHVAQIMQRVAYPLVLFPVQGFQRGINGAALRGRRGDFQMQRSVYAFPFGRRRVFAFRLIGETFAAARKPRLPRQDLFDFAAGKQPGFAFLACFKNLLFPPENVCQQVFLSGGEIGAVGGGIDGKLLPPSVRRPKRGVGVHVRNAFQQGTQQKGLQVVRQNIGLVAVVPQQDDGRFGFGHGTVVKKAVQITCAVLGEGGEQIVFAHVPTAVGVVLAFEFFGNAAAVYQLEIVAVKQQRRTGFEFGKFLCEPACACLAEI